MNNQFYQGRLASSLLALTTLLSISPTVTAATTHLCSGGAISCEVTANSFTSGSATLSGNAGTDTQIIDSGNTAALPVQTYNNFGTLENHGTFNSGNSTTNFPWLRVMGPNATLDNYGITNNQSDLYVQSNSVLGNGAPEGSGTIYNHSGGVFNNGTSDTYTNGEYFYGGISVYDDAAIINDGTFNNYSYLYVLDDASSFTNNGTFNNYAQEAHGTEVSLQGTMTNTGTIHSMAGAIMETGIFHNTATGTFINEGKLESSLYPGYASAFTNEGIVEITATATGQAPNFYKPGTFTQTAGSLKVDGQFIQSQFDIQGGTVTGGGVLDTTDSGVTGTAPTVTFGPASILNVGNGTDNELLIIGDVQLEGEIIFELGASNNDFLHIVADAARNSSIGYLDLGGLLTISLLSDFSANVGDSYDIITADGGLINDFISSVMFTVGDYTFERVVNTNTVSLSVFSKSISAVPLPAAVFLFAPALIGFIGLRRKVKIAVV